MQYKKIPYLGVFTALALLLGYVESLVPLPFLVPGMKLGLGNVIVLLLLYLMDIKSAFFVSLIKVLLSGLLFSGFSSMLYSLAGAMVGLMLMCIGKKINALGMVGVSVLGGIGHNIGQIVVAVLVIENLNLLYYFPVLLICGTITGVLVGVVGSTSIRYIERFFYDY